MLKRTPFVKCWLALGLMLAVVKGTSGQVREEIPVTVDCGRDAGPLEHFWRMTGFDYVQIGYAPGDASWALECDQRQQIIYVGAVPHGGITYIRIHNLLYLVSVEGRPADHPSYDWSKLDQVLDFLLSNRLKPFFEMMGVPKGLETAGKKDFANLSFEEWRALAKGLARHLIDRYGAEEVRTWYFEVWNEPDNWDLESLCRYYDACSAGLEEADPGLRWGGPGTWNTLFPLFKGLLTHCDSGKNYVTGQTGTRIDFISIHEKGIKRSSYYDGAPDIKEWVDRQIATLGYIRENHPRFARTPLINDECDPKGGWWNLYSWRDGPYFPAIIAKYVRHHLGRVTESLGANTMISNDNCMIGKWGMRSHVVRFGDQRRFELVKKPVNAGMIMLSLLGDRRCELRQPDLFSDVGAIATLRDREQVAVLVYNCNEAATRERHPDAAWVLEEYGRTRTRLQLENLPFREAMLVHYRIDRDHTCPFGVWEQMGKPGIPSAGQLARMRAQQELALLEPPREVRIDGGRLSLDFELPMPAVSLVLLSTRPAAGPGRVTGLRAERSPGLAENDEILLTWKGLPTRMIRTYEVLWADSPDAPPKRVNESDLLCTAFLHVWEKTGSGGYYRVRATDCWGRSGEPSEAIRSPAPP
jgi:L-iduronidase